MVEKLEKGVWDGESLWCGKCGRGVKGEEGSVCHQCLSRHEGEPGTLMTPPAYEEKKKIEAAAIKLARKENVNKAQKGLDEVKAELKDEIMNEIKAKYNITPKVSNIKTVVTGSTKKDPVGSGTSKS